MSSHLSVGLVLLLLAAGGVCLPPSTAYGAEAEQFLLWDKELADCALALNARLNHEIATFLTKANARKHTIKTGEELTPQLYWYLSKGLYGSRLKGWLRHAEEVDRLPKDDVSFFEYQNMSVYRDRRAFPFLLPIVRTIRVGEVYLGLDKIGHFFGVGRRYFLRYRRYLDEGFSGDEATEKVVRWGIFHERTALGLVVSGIFSHADMEANYQGLRFARDLCHGDSPHIVLKDGTWELVRPVDMRDYVTPDMDESWNTNHYIGQRKRDVLERVRTKYCAKLASPVVRARFEKYGRFAPSRSRRIIDAFYAARPQNPRAEHALTAICASCEAAQETLRLLAPLAPDPPLAQASEKESTE